MIYGIGTDILKISRIPDYNSEISKPFYKKAFTAKEIELARTSDNPVNFLAGRFAAKEAVFKTIRSGGDVILLNEIEILRAEDNSPVVSLSGKTACIAREAGISRIIVSISYDTDYAVAFALSEA